MLVALVVLLTEAALVLVSLTAAVVLWARNVRTAVHARVLVNLTNGSAFDGVLWQRRGRLLILRDARLIERGAEPVPVDGTVLLDRSRIEFVQARPGGGGA